MIIEKNTPSAQLETCYEAPAQIVLSVIVIKCSYTRGDWDQHPHQQILLGFFFPLSFPQGDQQLIWWSLFMWPAETQSNVLEQKKCYHGSCPKFPPVLGCQRFVTRPTSWLRGCCCLAMMGSWEGNIQCCLWPWESTVQEQTSFLSSLIGRNLNGMAGTTAWT